MLSKKAKYAIKALIYLAKRRGDGPVQIAEIAATENIPHKFLEAILLELKKGDVLQSRKGKGGGYYLPHDPQTINLAAIMRLMDGPIALLPCVTYNYYERCAECTDEATCSIRKVFQEVRNQTVAMLKEATLESLVTRTETQTQTQTQTQT